MRHRRYKGKTHSLGELATILSQMREEGNVGDKSGLNNHVVCNSNNKLHTNFCFSDKYLIVEKSKVMEDYQMTNELLTNANSSQSEKNNAIVIKSFIEDYFGKDTFSPTEL